MAVEKFDCASCGGHGKITFKEDDGTRFKHEVLFCPMCGTDLDNEVTPEEDYEE